MPVKGEEGTTPIKARWNTSNLSTTSGNTPGRSKYCLDLSECSINLLEISQDYLKDALEPDVPIQTSLEYGDSSADSSLLEKSRISQDSGISSLELELDHVPVVIPPRADPNTSASYKYKVSIYSKVSGCRMTNLTDYWIVKQIRVAILQRLTNGDPIQALSYKFGYEKMANGGLQIISDSEVLIEMLGSSTYFAGIPCKMTFPDTPRVVGFIKGLPTDLEPSDLKDEIRKSHPTVYSVRYVTERSRGLSHGMQRPCAFVSFNLRYLPKTVVIFDELFELQVPNPMQCTRCCRYGHQGKQCRAQARCSFCGGTHPKQICGEKIPSCINCLGTHTATSHDCLIWQQGKLMNELRYRGGMTAEEAIGIASSGKVSQKKHTFTQADFFENQDSLYFGSEISPPAEESFEEAPEQQQTSPQPMVGKVTQVHPRTAKIFPFLDLMTDFFLKVKNPGSDYTSGVLMPGYDELGFPKKNRKNSVAAKNFKESVQAAVNSSPRDNNSTHGTTSRKENIFLKEINNVLSK